MNNNDNDISYYKKKYNMIKKTIKIVYSDLSFSQKMKISYLGLHLIFMYNIIIITEKTLKKKQKTFNKMIFLINKIKFNNGLNKN
jgi:hypothetical protein